MVELGTLQTVELRDVWPHEAHNFTKWLSEVENLKLLGDALEMDLECIDVESSVGSFNVDILAREANTGAYVVIENQLEDTNHDHLGKIITYAAGKDASACIWIVRHARDEHREAIEWLNRHTDDSIAFFLVEIKVWQIGDSAKAPQFCVIECPNEWSRTQKIKSTLSDQEKIQLSYWQGFYEKAMTDMRIKHCEMRVGKPSQNSWFVLRTGQPTYHIGITAPAKQRRIGVEAYFPDCKEQGRALIENMQEIANQIGAKPAPFDAKKASGVRFWRENIDFGKDPNAWPEYFEWQIDSACKLREFLRKLGI